MFQNACQEFAKNIQGFDQNVLDLLTEYPWPGNVRELKNVIQRAVLICRGKLIKIEHLPQRLQSSKRYVDNMVIPVGTSLKEVEKFVITKTLAMTKGNRKKAADVLGISRRALYNKIKSLDIL